MRSANEFCLVVQGVVIVMVGMQQETESSNGQSTMQRPRSKERERVQALQLPSDHILDDPRMVEHRRGDIGWWCSERRWRYRVIFSFSSSLYVTSIFTSHATPVTLMGALRNYSAGVSKFCLAANIYCAPIVHCLRPDSPYWVCCLNESIYCLPGGMILPKSLHKAR